MFLLLTTVGATLSTLEPWLCGLSGGLVGFLEICIYLVLEVISDCFGQY